MFYIFFKWDMNATTLLLKYLLLTFILSVFVLYIWGSAFEGGMYFITYIFWRTDRYKMSHALFSLVKHCLGNILSYTIVITLAFLWLLFAWYIFLSFSFNLFISLNLKYVSCRQHITGYYFSSSTLIVSASWLNCLIHSYLM